MKELNILRAPMNFIKETKEIKKLVYEMTLRKNKSGEYFVHKSCPIGFDYIVFVDIKDKDSIINAKRLLFHAFESKPFS